MKVLSPDLYDMARNGTLIQSTVFDNLFRFVDWRDEYDFGRIEARLNALPQFVTEIDGVDIHFIHVKSQHENALPVIVTHGWPGSIIELLGVIGPLTDPTAHGGRAEDAFDVVLPSLLRAFSTTPGVA